MGGGNPHCSWCVEKTTMFFMRIGGKLADTLSDVVKAIDANTKQRKHEFDWFRSHLDLATKQDLKDMENRIMSKISEYIDRVNAKFDEIDTGLTGLTTAVSGIADDVTFLKDTITELQNNPGPISPEDQVLLDALETRVGTTATKVTAASSALKALDDATTRPTPPPA